jgi:hypothetical protein
MDVADGRDRAEGEEMSANDLQELADMAMELEATARKLPQGQGRDDLLRDVANFRSQLIARLPSEGIEVKRSDGGKGKR